MQVSDDEDQVRLRILADPHTYKVGDTAKVQLHWREEPALALVTFQGARVLDYKLVDLKKGANELAIPMTAKLAPNFELAVAVMTERARGEGRQRTAEAENATAAGPHPNPLPREDQDGPPRSTRPRSPFTVERDLRVKIAAKRKGDAKGRGPSRARRSR